MTLPTGLQNFLDETGGISPFIARFFKEGFKPRYEFAEMARQCFFIGYKSLPLIGITAFIMGLVITIARALINSPSIIMCDEPTGNLDKKNSLIVFDIFKKLAEEHQQTLLVVTHDLEFANNTHRIIVMEDGRIIDQ